MRLLRSFLVVLLVLGLARVLCGENGDEPVPIPGILILHNGTELPASLVESFVQIAGRTDANIVYVSGETLTPDELQKALQPFLKWGAASVKALCIGSRND